VSRVDVAGFTFLENRSLPATFEKICGWPKEATMLELIVFTAVVLALISMLGAPYPQTWHGRWGSSDR
jgi:hypothetical protein